MTTVAIPTPTRPPRRIANSTSMSTGTLQVTKRGLLRYFRTPQLVVLGTIQGALFLLIFRYVFGGAMSIPGTSYVNFLVPGFVTTGVLFTGQGAATAVAEDLQQGFVDRLRSLPVPRACFLAGRAIADTVWTTWGLLVAIAVGLGVGFRPDGSAAGIWLRWACASCSGSPSSGCSCWSACWRGHPRPPRAWPS